MRIHFPPHFRSCSPISNTQPDQNAKTSICSIRISDIGKSEKTSICKTSKFSDFPMQCSSAVVSGLLVLFAGVCGDARKVCLAAACSSLVTWVGLVTTCCVGGGTSVKNVQNHQKKKMQMQTHVNISVQLLKSSFLDPSRQYLKPIDFSWCFLVLNISNPGIVEVPRAPQTLTVMTFNIVCDVHSFRFQERLCVY